MADKNRSGRSWVRFSGMGIEFAAAVGGFTVVGYWIDLHYGCAPWGVLIGVILGLIGGMYNMIRQSLAAVRQTQEKPADEAPAKDEPADCGANENGSRGG